MFRSMSDPAPVRPGAEPATMPTEFNSSRDTAFEIERLLMITEALWTMLKEQHDYQDDDLLRRVAEIDMRDGSLDGRVHAQVTQDCPECGRKLARKRPNCIYCSAFVPPDPFER